MLNVGGFLRLETYARRGSLDVPLFLIVFVVVE